MIPATIPCPSTNAPVPESMSENPYSSDFANLRGKKEKSTARMLTAVARRMTLRQSSIRGMCDADLDVAGIEGQRPLEPNTVVAKIKQRAINSNIIHGAMLTSATVISSGKAVAAKSIANAKPFPARICCLAINDERATESCVDESC